MKQRADLSSLTLPESITNPTSSMVIDVSATFVARTTFVMPLGGRSNTLNQIKSIYSAKMGE